MEFFLVNVSAATDLCLIICIRRRARGGDVRARLLFLRPRGGNAEADMQSVLNALFSLTEHGSVCDEEKIDTAIQQIIDQQSFAYSTLLYQLPSKQKELLVAICKEGKAMNLTSARFLKKYKLTSSSVQSAIRGLLEKDLVTNDLGTFSPYDLFFALWMRQQM